MRAPSRTPGGSARRSGAPEQPREVARRRLLALLRTLTPRGRLVVGLGAVCYLAAWALGSGPLYPVALGLVLAACVALAWVRLSVRPMRLVRETRRIALVEGDRVPVRLELEHERGFPPPPSLVVVERIGRLGERATALEGRSGGYLLPALPRGRYPFEHVRALVEDPFGLAAAEVPLEGGGALCVRPRVAAVERLFSEGGAGRVGGSRPPVRRAVGLDVHGVREWAYGEPLRHVHWRSTARRAQLMVKELEDVPRDEVAVLLDAHPTVERERFDLQVRAAASLLRAYVSRRRDARLHVNRPGGASLGVRSLGSDWEAALDLLAAAEPDARRPVEALLAEDGAAAGALEVAVVTDRLSRGLADRLVALSGARLPVSLVLVGEREPEVARLRAAGVAVAVVAAGADLAAALSACREAAVG